MIWILPVFFACIVIAGRAHSRYLDRLDEENTWLFVDDRRLKVVRQRSFVRADRKLPTE
jgi:hypothetical protein